MLLVLFGVCDRQRLDSGGAAGALTPRSVHRSEGVWLDVPNLEGMYECLAVEVEHLCSLVAEGENQPETGYAVNALDLGGIAVRRRTRIKTGNNLR